MSDIQYTKYFDTCKGVFQGGGCKAIAYIGAYKEAYRLGVFFSELAGTSAGSIIAALIAAGATPEYLEKKVRGTDFKQFIKKYKSSGLFTRLVLWWNLPWGHKKKAKYMNLTQLKSKWGIFNAGRIESYIEDCLRELTGMNEIVKFRDLIPDLYVVCSDLEQHRVKIWSKAETPNDSVAKAVSASCSIPIIFQPVENRYVDGGILSNLPNFIFSKEPHYNRILCFRNRTAENMGHLSGVEDYVGALVGTITEGADYLQQLLLHESYDVPIVVDGIKATDFDKINDTTITAMTRHGEEAMAKLLNDEATFISQKGNLANVMFENEEKVHSMVAYISMKPHKEVCVSAEDTYWTWILFLSIVKWINDGAKVNVFTSKTISPKYAEAEQARRRMLKAMGCNIYELEHLTVKGFFFLDRDTWSGVAYEKNENEFMGKYYNSPLDSPLIKEWVLKYKKETPELATQKKRTIGIKAVKDSDIFKLLKNEPTYVDARLEFKTIDLKDILFMNPYIRALKYKQIQMMFDLYGDRITRFGAATLTFPGGKESVVGPPLVEERNGKYYLIEGNTRCVYAYRHGITKLNMVVAHDVQQQLPCEPSQTYTIQQVLISDRKIKGIDRYKDFDYNLFRHIEQALRPYDTYMI